jgi:hypothetical protein
MGDFDLSPSAISYSYNSAAKGAVSDCSLRLEVVYPDSINEKQIVTGFDTLELIGK